MQSLVHGAEYGSNPVTALLKIVRDEGVFRPVRGIQALAIGAIPAHAGYFATYEYLKDAMGHGIMATGIAGCAAAMIHDAVMNPAEVVKQRMQMQGSPYRGCTDCVIRVMRTEGFRAFYRSYVTQLAMNVPFQSIHFMVYESAQARFNSRRRYNPTSHVVSGALAGGVAAAVTTPFDVCKTLLNTQEKQERCPFNEKNKPVVGLRQAVFRIYQCCGMRGYFQGLSARIVYQMPATAVSWSVYEFFKYMLSERNR